MRLKLYSAVVATAMLSSYAQAVKLDSLAAQQITDGPDVEILPQTEAAIEADAEIHSIQEQENVDDELVLAAVGSEVEAE